MTDLFHRPATDVAALLRTGDVSARDLTEQLLERIDKLNPTVNAVVETDRDAALRAAAEADDALARGGPLGPLHGVPITVKVADIFLCPAAFTAAFRHPEGGSIGTPDGERSYHDIGLWIAHAALAGLPVVSAPIGWTPGGLPVGAQLIGPRHGDDTAITCAELAAQVVGGFVAPGVAG
jgi:Asp-tRNA(Asn)/Glu-tRNA(Gln) amidotransferase A subunit family amidase